MDLRFDKVSFWIQVHDIPIQRMSKAVSEDICDDIGKVRRSRDPNINEWGSFMRVKVVVNITLPLCQGRVVTLELGERTWVRFKYE